MNLAHIEELSKDKDLMYAYMVSCFKYNEGKGKAWKDLTEEQKMKLIADAEYFYFKDGSGASIGRICDLVMEHQAEVLNGKMTKRKFLDLLVDYEVEY